MKKLTLALLISIAFICGCTKNLNSYTEVSYEELQNMKQETKTFPLVIGSSTCSACESYKITMRSFIEKYQTEVYFIDLDKLTDDEETALRLETNYDSTPTTLFYEEGKLTMSYNRLVGAGNLQSVKELFKQNEYLK